MDAKPEIPNTLKTLDPEYPEDEVMMRGLVKDALERHPADQRPLTPEESYVTGIVAKSVNDIAQELVKDELRHDGLPNPGSPPPRFHYALGVETMPDETVLSRQLLAKALKCGVRTTRRMEELREIPPGATLGQRTFWKAGEVRKWILRRISDHVQRCWDEWKAEPTYEPGRPRKVLPLPKAVKALPAPKAPKAGKATDDLKKLKHYKPK